MTWAFLDDHADENPKLLAVGAEAAWYYACGLCYCRRSEANGAPGFIPAGKAFTLYAVKNVRKVVRLLVEARLWVEVDGGYDVHDYGKVYGRVAAEGPSPDLSAKRAEAGRLGGLRSASARRSKQGTAQPKQTPEANRSKHTEANTRSKPKPTAPEASTCLDPRARGSDSGSYVTGETTAKDLTGSARQKPPDAAADQRVRCPSDLDLTDDERGNVEMAGVPGWAIDVLVPTCRAKLTSQDPRTPPQWHRSLVSAVIGHWQDPRKRPRRDEPERAPDDALGGYIPA